RTPFDAEHHLLRGTVDVGVEQADGVAERAQREREVGGDGRFADAPLARGDGDLVLHSGEDAALSGRRGGLLARADVERDMDVRDAGNGAHRVLRVARDLLADGGIFGLETDGEDDLSAFDAKVVNESE